jgi:hypothetical protein
MTDPKPNPSNTSARRPRPAAPIVIRPPIAVPLDEQRRQRAVSALTVLLSHWWDQHGRHLPAASHDGADPADQTDQPDS